MRVSIVNPSKKKKGSHKAKKSSGAKKPWMKGLAAARKARKAKAKSHKASTPKKKKKSSHKAKPKKKKMSHKAKPKKKKKSHKASGFKAVIFGSPKKKKKKSSHKAKAKPKKKKKKKAKTSHKAKKKSKGRKSRKVITKKLGKRTRPVMYKHGKSVSHSPVSKLSRKGFRFNPGMKGIKAHVVKVGKFKSFKSDFVAAPISHLVGMGGGFLSSAYVGGYVGKMIQDQTKNELYSQAGSLVGNFVGTEVPAIIVHWGLPKVGMKKYAEPIARGMRVGGYIALILNGFTLVLKALNVPLPYRALGMDATAKEYMLSGIGDIDLVRSGISALQPNWQNTSEYSALDDESAGLVDQINALSQYVVNDEDFAGYGRADKGNSGSIADL